MNTTQLIRRFQAVARLLTGVALLLLSVGSSAIGQDANRVPEPGQGIEVKEAEHIGKYVPQRIEFFDEQHKRVSLSDYLNNDRPIMLSFNYSNCPKLCHTQLSNMAYSIQDIGLVPGKDFEIVSISIDPTEQSAKALKTKQKYLDLYGRQETANGWHFLTGSKGNIKLQADSVGVSYRYIPESNSYSHSSVFIMLAPDGKIVRYIYGLEVEPRVLELALTEAGQGKIGSPINKGFLLTGCFVYDQFTGQYTMQWMGLMRIGGGLTAYLVFLFLVPVWARWLVLYLTFVVGWLGLALLYLIGGNFFMFMMVSFVGSPFFMFATVMLAMYFKSKNTAEPKIERELQQGVSHS